MFILLIIPAPRIKPRNDGSSFGVVIVKETDSAPERSLWPTTTDLMAEVYIPGGVNRMVPGALYALPKLSMIIYDFDANKPADRYCACRYSRTYYHTSL